jgi:hypothetical protein
MLLGNVKRYKGRLEANDLTQRRGIDYHGMNGSWVMLNDIKVDLKPMILLKGEALIIMV